MSGYLAILLLVFSWSVFEKTKLRCEAEVLEADSSDAVRFTRILKRAITLEERTDLVENLWSVVLSDDDRDHEEDAQMRMISNLLGINYRDNARQGKGFQDDRAARVV